MHCGVNRRQLLTVCISVLHHPTDFAGSNATENLEIFSIVDAAADAWVHIYDANFHEKNEELKVSKVIICF